MTNVPRLDRPLAIMPRKLKLSRQPPRLLGHWAAVLAACCLLAHAKAQAQAQTGRLNDTGQTTCYNASNAAVA